MVVNWGMYPLVREREPWLITTDVMHLIRYVW